MTHSGAISELMEVDIPSLVGAIFKGTGLFLGPMLKLWLKYQLGFNDNFLQVKMYDLLTLTRQ